MQPIPQLRYNTEFDYRFHRTGLKFVEIILDLIQQPLTNILDSYFDIPFDERGDIGNRLRDIFSEQMLNIVINRSEKYRKGFVMGDKRILIKVYIDSIYIGIIAYLVAEANNKNISLIITWDIIDILTDQIKIISFPSKELSVQFILDGEPIPGVYNLTLDQFMGMAAGSLSIPNRISTIILGISTELNSFLLRLQDYSRDKLKIYKSYSIKIAVSPLLYSFKDYEFDNLDFITGFVTIFGWIGKNHHGHWTTFKQWNDPKYPQGKDLTF